MVKKIKEGEWGVFHSHPQKPGSKTDKPAGTLIAKHKTKKAAEAQHRAIMASENKKGK